MNVEHKIIANAFTLEEEYINTYEAYCFANDKSAMAAYVVFIEELLEKYDIVKSVDTYYISEDDAEGSLRSLASCDKNVGSKLRLDIYDTSEKEYRVFTYEEKDEEEIKKALSLSVLEYHINDYKRLQNLEDALLKIFDEYEKETKDPYSYYGVSRKDFY